MPIYEFKCNSCSHKFELMRPISRSSEGAECPRCRQKSDRIISTCYSMSTTDGGIPQPIGGSGSSCSSCSSGNCSTCGH